MAPRDLEGRLADQTVQTNPEVQMAPTDPGDPLEDQTAPMSPED